jgi:cytoskeletal protein CcmA (bactofilin family)
MTREASEMFTKSGGKDPGEAPLRRLEDEVGAKETMIAAGSTVQGKILGQIGVRVAGSFEGEIKIDSVLWIERQGAVQGTVNARGVIIEGEMRGNIDASEKVEIRSSGRVFGDVLCKKIALAEGCFFQGGIKMPEGEDRPVTFVERRQGASEPGEPQPGG